jgi:hypothetical protein
LRADGRRVTKRHRLEGKEGEMTDTVTDLGSETRRTGKHMRRVDGRKPRYDIGLPAPEKRRSPEHYARMQEAMRRSKRTDLLVRLLRSTVPLTEAQMETIRIALEGVPVLDDDTVEVAGAA